jgi:hypothetical protein
MSTKTTVTGDRDSLDPGCRACCSIPSGRFAGLSTLFVSIALALTWTAARSCHYIGSTITYRQPPEDPEPTYSCCGDCYCISGSEPCPSSVPNMNISEETITMFKSLTPMNPYNLTCNPDDTQYTGVPCETTPPQNFTELGDTAGCGVLYDTTTLNAVQCPTQYCLQSFPDLASAQAAGATMTHYS